VSGLEYNVHQETVVMYGNRQCHWHPFCMSMMSALSSFVGALSKHQWISCELARSRTIWMTNHHPSVHWHHWLDHRNCRNSLWNDL